MIAIEAASKSSGSGSSLFFLFIILAFGVLWLLVIRPQRKRQAKARQMVDELQVGDRVLTAGGIYGTVRHLDEDDEVGVEIARDTEVRLSRRAIAQILREPDEPVTAPEPPTAEE